MLPLSLAFLLCLATVLNAESTTTKAPSPKKTRTANKETYVPKEPANSPTNFGFVPVKTSENYIQKEPLGRYVYPDLLGQTQAYTSKFPSYQTTQQQISYQPQVQYSQQQITPSYNFAATQSNQQYVYPQQYYQHQAQPTQDFSQFLEYQFGQPQTQYYQEPAIKNVNYIAANSVPQYVYLQQSSNAVENVIPKEHGVKFLMIIPQYVPQQPSLQNYYLSQQTAPQDYTTATLSQQPDQVQYVYKTEPSVNSQKLSSYEKGPTSLLDSYVPSVLQVQYYKKLQAQSQVNKIASDEKPPAESSGKSHGKHER